MTNRLPVLEILLAGIETFGCHLLFFFLLLLLNAVLPFSPFSSAPLLFALMLLLLALCTLRIFTGLGKDSAHHHKASCSPRAAFVFLRTRGLPLRGNKKRCFRRKRAARKLRALLAYLRRYFSLRILRYVLFFLPARHKAARNRKKSTPLRRHRLYGKRGAPRFCAARQKIHVDSACQL